MIDLAKVKFESLSIVRAHTYEITSTEAVGSYPCGPCWW